MYTEKKIFENNLFFTIFFYFFYFIFYFAATGPSISTETENEKKCKEKMKSNGIKYDRILVKNNIRRSKNIDINV